MGTLTRLTKNLLISQKKVLADLYAREEAICSAQTELLQRFKRETEKINKIALPYDHYPTYRKTVFDKRDLMTKQLNTVRQDVERQKNLITETYQSLKRYEIAHDKMKEMIEKELLKKEQDMLDEISLQQHQRLKNNA